MHYPTCVKKIIRSTNVIVSNLSRDNILFQHFTQVCFFFLVKKLGRGGGTGPPAPPLATALPSKENVINPGKKKRYSKKANVA